MQESRTSSPQTTSKGRRRQKLILALGIISLVLAPLCGLFAYILRSEFAGSIFLSSFLIAVPLGIAASVMAVEELRKIRDGILPVSARGLTKTGGILGLVGTVVYSLLFCGILFQLFTSSGISSPKDCIINDLGNLAATAYQYRIRPASMGGGAGSYAGFVMPSKMQSNDNATYACTALANEVTFSAISAENMANTVMARIDSEGHFIPEAWKFSGDFDPSPPEFLSRYR